jgi:hypothetical protein
MRVFKFFAGGVIALFVLSALLKAFIFLAIAAVIIGGLAFIGRSIAQHFYDDTPYIERKQAFRHFMKNELGSRGFDKNFEATAFQTRTYKTIEII